MRSCLCQWIAIAAIIGSAISAPAENQRPLTAALGLGTDDESAVPAELVDQLEFGLGVIEAERIKRHEKLKVAYVAKLTETALAATKASKLQDAMSAKAEIERVRGDNSSLPDDFRPFTGLSRLRSTYYKARAANDYEIEEMRKSALQNYGRKLQPRAKASLDDGDLDASISIKSELKLAAAAVEQIAKRISYLARAKTGAVVNLGSRVVPRHLTEGLALYYSFDSLENAGLSWSKSTFTNHKLSSKVKIKESGWRRSADFRKAQSYMRFTPKRFPLGENWSITFWLTLPNDGAHLLTTNSAHPFIVGAREINCYFGGSYHNFWRPAREDYPEGWTFFGVTFDGKTLTLYMNGDKVATKVGTFGNSIGLLGNRPGTHGDWSMVKDLDDLMFFQRVLDPFEVKDLFEWTSFPNPP